jgi:thiol-disulfide isomerase/thioredoxin
LWVANRPALEVAIEEAADAPGRVLADRLPSITLENLDGVPTPLTTWPGKPLIVNFWATWCAPCLREIPMFKAFQAEHADVQVVGIAVDRLDPVVAFAAEMDFNYPVLVGETEAMNAVAAFGVQVLALPITVFTDGSGAVLGVRTGEVHAEQLASYVATLAGLKDGQLDLTAARARLSGTL